MRAEAIPVILLTGFLGSGKSTLLTDILKDPEFRDTAVVVNEFGDVGLDDFLVEHSLEQMVEMTAGCLCCTIRGDIRETLLDLHRRRELGDIPRFRRLVVETTGLADPAPVIHTLMAEPRLMGIYCLAGVMTTVDALNGESSLSRHIECVKQVAVADRIVLTKTDIAVDSAQRENIKGLREAIARINPAAPILDRNDRGFDYRELFDASLWGPGTKSLEVQKWLDAEAYDGGRHHIHHAVHAHDGVDHAHDVNRHGTDIRAYCLVLEEPVSTMAFTTALELLLANQGPDLLRIKGIINLAEKPERPVIIHGVQHVFHEPVWLDEWPSDDRRTRIVFITRNIPKDTIETFFLAWQRLGSERAVRTLQSSASV